MTKSLTARASLGHLHAQDIVHHIRCLTLRQGWFGDRIGRGPGATLLSAALAGASSTVVLQPLEVVRSRISCDTVGRYSKGIPAAMGTMLHQEGPMALYTGLASSLAAIIPEAAITYGEQAAHNHCMPGFDVLLPQSAQMVQQTFAYQTMQLLSTCAVSAA